MYKIISGSTHGLRDTEDFIESLDDSLGTLPREWRELFDPQPELIVTRAPGRIDLMGGIADYSGSLVLPLPIANATHCALQQVPNRTIRIASLPQTSNEIPRLLEVALEELFVNESPIGYAEARAKFAHDPQQHWAAYIVGAFVVLLREGHLTSLQGANILIRSSVPEGKGVSSSAALEVAVMQAVIEAYQITISAYEAALLCQKV